MPRSVPRVLGISASLDLSLCIPGPDLLVLVFNPRCRYQLLSVTHELVAASNTRLWMHFIPIAVMSPSEANKRTRRLALTRGNILLSL